MPTQPDDDDEKKPRLKRNKQVSIRLPSDWAADAEARAKREGMSGGLLEAIWRFVFHFGQGEIPPEGFVLPPTPEDHKPGRRAPGAGRPPAKRKKK